MALKPLFLRVHRWLTLLFALPLAVVIVTGLVLSVEPILNDRAVSGHSLALASIESAMAKFDPDRKATSLAVRAYENTMVLSEGRGGIFKRIAIDTQTLVPSDKRLWSDTLLTARRLHETLLLDLKWLVDASTAAMLLSMVVGLAMGWPTFRNSLGGWHRTTGWLLSPLLLLSPLTGLALAFGINFTPPPARVPGAPLALVDAVRMVAAKYDPASIVWIRPQGGALRARIYDGGEAKVMAVTRDGLVAGPQSWPRALHEGVWAGAWSGLLNMIVSLALIGLMSTGLIIWARRTFRARPVRVRTTTAS